MSIPIPPPLSAADFEAVESAVMETSRGRWFLAEFARRRRQADTAMLLTALERLKNVAREATAGRLAVSADPVPGFGDLVSSPEMQASPPEVVASAAGSDMPWPDAQERPAPALQRARDPLAPLAAMSYEEKIALFT